MVSPGCRYTGLIPPLPFARGIAASVQHRGNLVVAVSNSHATNDLQRLHGRGRFSCGTWSFHRELRMRTSLPVNQQLKVFFILVSAHNDLFDGGAEDHLLKCRGTVVALPDSSKMITHRTYSDFLWVANWQLWHKSPLWCSLAQIGRHDNFNSCAICSSWRSICS